MSDKRPVREVRVKSAVSEASLEAVRTSAESQAIVDALREAHQNVSAAAIRLGITRSTMYRRMRRYGLRVSRAAARS
jgi:transcriptional regulator of acetoin/glycerol metabolism